MNPALLTKYKEEVVTVLKEQFGYKNMHEVPLVEKVVINCGVGKAESDRKQAVQDALDAIALITGQRGVPTAAKNSISNFKLRAGELVGAKVTLRGTRMYECLLRLIGTAIPSIRDFRGVSPKAFDGRGNYSIGLKEQLIFPEIDYDKIEKVQGMNITICTTARNDEEGRCLLTQMGLPLRK